MKVFSFLAPIAVMAEVNLNPHGDDRFCDYYKMTAEASFDTGFTENVPAAMHNGATKVSGVLKIEQTSCKGPVTITGKLTGLSPGKHGWHVHQFGGTTTSCGSSATGGHWNPYNAPEGEVEKGRAKRELGQIGNIECDANGECDINVSDRLIKLHGLRNIVGRSLVIHQFEDKGYPKGDSGSRVACATIVFDKLWDPAPKNE